MSTDTCFQVQRGLIKRTPLYPCQIEEDALNRDKLDITSELSTGSYLYNGFVSEVFFEPGNEDRDALAISLCVERLEDVAFVEIRMTKHHAIVITRSTKNSLATAAAVTG